MVLTSSDQDEPFLEEGVQVICYCGILSPFELSGAGHCQRQATGLGGPWVLSSQSMPLLLYSPQSPEGWVPTFPRSSGDSGWDEGLLFGPAILDLGWVWTNSQIPPKSVKLVLFLCHFLCDAAPCWARAVCHQHHRFWIHLLHFFCADSKLASINQEQGAKAGSVPPRWRKQNVPARQCSWSPGLCIDASRKRREGS